MSQRESMNINGVPIFDAFAEAFPMTATRIIITAADAYWARQAAESMTGFATSVIGCGCEAGIEEELAADDTPDGRPGIAVLLFAVSGSELEKQLTRRVGQCVLTCPSASAFAGMQGDKKIAMGDQVRYFGDGFQQSKIMGGRRLWRVPVMDGEFICEDKTARQAAVGGGNFVVLSKSISSRSCASSRRSSSASSPSSDAEPAAMRPRGPAIGGDGGRTIPETLRMSELMNDFQSCLLPAVVAVGGRSRRWPPLHAAIPSNTTTST
jgi:formylmethanofuran:tetrahydromethanopterin formyltransferase